MIARFQPVCYYPSSENRNTSNLLKRSMKSPRKKVKQNPLYEVWDQVPVDYYQQGVKKSLLQNIWHSKKINLAKKLLEEKNFQKCLDIGCASGYMVSEVSKHYPKAKYVGVDSYDK